MPPVSPRYLIDTDVLLDVALNRERFVQDSASVLRHAELGGHAVIAWHSLSNCAYLLKDEGRNFLEGLLQIVEIAPVSREMAQTALNLPMRDLEDALQATCAQHWQAHYIVTRNIRDYKGSPVPAILPGALLTRINP
jgi:predicted nucleic acid-binding protein